MSRSAVEKEVKAALAADKAEANRQAQTSRSATAKLQKSAGSSPKEKIEEGALVKTYANVVKMPSSSMSPTVVPTTSSSSTLSSPGSGNVIVKSGARPAAPEAAVAETSTSPDAGPTPWTSPWNSPSRLAWEHEVTKVFDTQLHDAGYGKGRSVRCNGIWYIRFGSDYIWVTSDQSWHYRNEETGKISDTKNMISGSPIVLAIEKAKTYAR